jgi:hypothetical protein
MLIVSLLLIIIPIGLIIAGGILVRKRGDPETVELRYFLFLIWTAIGLSAAVLLYWTFPHPGYSLVLVFVLIIPAMVVMTLLRLNEWHDLPARTRVSILSVIVLLMVWAVVQFWRASLNGEGRALEPTFLGMLLLSVSAFLFIAWKWGSRHPFLPGVIAILYLTIFNILEIGSLSLPSDSLTGVLNALGALAYLAVPGLVIAAMAILTSNVLDMTSRSGGVGQVPWRPVVGRLALILILLGYLLYTFKWLWIWDGTDDGIRWLIMLMASSIAALSAGLVIALTDSGWRWAGIVFAVSVIGSLYLAGMTSFGTGDEVTNYTVTGQRAVRIQQAIEEHRVTTGKYPAELRELVPGELWRIPLPMIIPDQDWCYESGPDHYRLGLVYRDHWSSPYLSLRVYASAGNVPETTWICDEKLADLQVQYDALFHTPPTPVPQPTSVTSVERIRIDPFYKESSFSVGSWSPDGAYLVFGSTEYFMDEVEHVTIDLRFLDARTGDICQPEPGMWTVQKSNGLRDHHAWLPDGRFLYVTDEGEMAAFEPCTGGMEDLANRFPVSFTHAVTFEAESGRVLLKNQEGYWLLDGSRLEVQPVAGVPVDADDGLWTWYAWSQEGARLAISMLLGPQGSDGGILYIIDGQSGEVMHSLPLPDASDAYLPVVEWLTRDDLLVRGNSLTVLDLGSDPPAMTDLIRDVFLLNMEYPTDVSSMDSRPGSGGQGYTVGLRVNHPNNQGIYLFDSGSGQVTVFQHNTATLFFFSDGQCLRLSKWEDDPTFQDVYGMVWMERPAQEHLLVVEGHTPRIYPQIFPMCLPGSSRLVFSSSQGISLISLPDGRTLRFWELAGGGITSQIYPAPSEDALVVAADGDGLYYIPLPPQ